MVKEKLTYIQAKSELVEIVQSIEENKLDIDQLIDKVKRASTLISFCKDKLTATDEELKKILDNIY